MSSWRNEIQCDRRSGPIGRSGQRRQRYCRDEDDDVIFLGRVENNRRRNNDEMSNDTPSVIALDTQNNRQRFRSMSVPGNPGREGFEVTYYRPPETANYPHPRDACLYHPFSMTANKHRGPYRQNDEHCDKCYCYVCDKPAKECRVWTSRSHCNAHSKSSHWRRSREKAKDSRTRQSAFDSLSRTHSGELGRNLRLTSYLQRWHDYGHHLHGNYDWY